MPPPSNRTAASAAGGDDVDNNNNSRMRRRALCNVRAPMLRTALFLLLLVWYCVPAGSTVCPNQCSGHGSCNFEAKCQCKPGWDVVADCSQQRCPYDIAWADKAYEMDKADSLAECSNNGLCDRSTGQCQCFNGYSGFSCSAQVSLPPLPSLARF